MLKPLKLCNVFLLCHVFLIKWLEIYVVDEHIWYLDWEEALLNDWDICCWWEYMILGWRGERWTCDVWFAYVHKSDSCSYECGTWIDVMTVWPHCALWSDNVDGQCVPVMQCICAFDWMLEVNVVDENMLQCICAFVWILDYMLLTRVCDAWNGKWICDIWFALIHGRNLCKYNWWNWIEVMTIFCYYIMKGRWLVKA